MILHLHLPRLSWLEPKSSPMTIMMMMIPHLQIPWFPSFNINPVFRSSSSSSFPLLLLPFSLLNTDRLLLLLLRYEYINPISISFSFFHFHQIKNNMLMVTKTNVIFINIYLFTLFPALKPYSSISADGQHQYIKALVKLLPVPTMDIK